ncbi:hypothetical protein DCW30_35685 [Streptomyces alfalfae]|uniref:Uncharacterized protein n=1 Tax=Streptomyces alfalfae TaxID=1642299 RepID=A0ABM6H273_9ACTN|nr:hypothetical protein [Streptomyces alfalfae]AYA20681.1 hypothetical protein D3X13_34590 [Streptomyces fradiae]APY90224.1 hypothetical protein A7J05_35250 [Streptomyces alfalfae]QUI29695.1 hypothetical protein H9W91_01555 [Streptomyces alfalfae]RXX34888.1 hypothetical protein DCW30_35685 [Streptomyces alfalfae]RZM97993.1 hypothetical protein D4104_12950 [Streptomyces alfalfae]
MPRTLERENRGTTGDEARAPARWSGWASVPTVFLDGPGPDEPIHAPGGDREGGFETDHAAWESYSRVRGELRDLLDPFEWRSASRAVRGGLPPSKPRRSSSATPDDPPHTREPLGADGQLSRASAYTVIASRW